ncbi:hypothetical protein LCGC14_1209300, partial [marine sediment metagenome]
VYDNDFLRFLFSKDNIKEYFSHRCSNVQDTDIIRKVVILLKILDNLRAKAVISKKDISAAQDENLSKLLSILPRKNTFILLPRKTEATISAATLETTRMQ